MKVSTQVYRSGDRFESRQESFTRYSVLNFEEHQDDAHKPFGSLIALNNETLDPKHKVFRHVEHDMEIIIIPLAGALLYSDSQGNEDIIETQQIRVFSADRDMTYTLENPYPEDLVNYLQIWILPSMKTPAGSSQAKLDYPGKNDLFAIFSASENCRALPVRQQANGFMGIFDDRETGSFDLSNVENGVFLYVLHGSFEVENNLLERYDALALTGLESVSFKAFQANSLLMLIEVPV